MVAAPASGVDGGGTITRRQSEDDSGGATSDLLSQIAQGMDNSPLQQPQQFHQPESQQPQQEPSGAVSGGAVSGGAVSGGAVSGGAVSGGAVSSDAVSGGTFSSAGVSDMPNTNPHTLSGMTGASHVISSDPITGYTPLQVSNNPANSPTDVMVNRIAEAEKEVKTERRSQWLQMNHDSAANVLGSIAGELPSHLQQQNDPAKALLKQTMGGGEEEGPAPSLLRRMSEVAVRRVARKRGVAVETPQIKPEGDVLNVNVTYVDDGRVLDSPADLCGAFQHAISTELALKGVDMSTEVTLFCSRDGEVEKVHGRGSADGEDEEDMFACEMCAGLVRESDSKCPHCGAEFDDEEEPPSGPPGRGPGGGGPPGRGPGGGGPPGRGPGGGGPPGRGPGSGGPSGPKRGPPGSGGPPGRGGGPSGPKRGPPGSGGGSGGPGGGGPSGGGPPGRSPGGGGPSGGGPPGRSPSGGSPGGGPPGSGGDPGGPKRGPPGSGGPSGGGPPGSGGGPGGPRRGPPGSGGGPPGGPKKRGPPR
jgi:hypothetical protein